MVATLWHQKADGTDDATKQGCTRLCLPSATRAALFFWIVVFPSRGSLCLVCLHLAPSSPAFRAEEESPSLKQLKCKQPPAAHQWFRAEGFRGQDCKSKTARGAQAANIALRSSPGQQSARVCRISGLEGSQELFKLGDPSRLICLRYQASLHPIVPKPIIPKPLLNARRRNAARRFPGRAAADTVFRHTFHWCRFMGEKGLGFREAVPKQASAKQRE